MEVRLTATFFKDGDWWVASVPEIPGVTTQGATLEEARENVLDALSLILECNRELAERELAGRDVIREELTVVPTAR
jgi:predicted RNase H-like HicB family nuclease